MVMVQYEYLVFFEVVSCRSIVVQCLSYIVCSCGLWQLLYETSASTCAIRACEGACMR